MTATAVLGAPCYLSGLDPDLHAEYLRDWHNAQRPVEAKKIRATFERRDVEVLGLHTVFEHHAVMGGREALAAFMHEYRVDFPVAMDQPSVSSPIPLTMAQYDMRGTPTLILIDRNGILRHQIFGVVDDMKLGALVAGLVAEAVLEGGCDDGACRI